MERMSGLARERLDRLMVDRGLAESRERAQALIMAGAVAVDGQPARRAAMPVNDEAQIAVQAKLPYVSRGGLKLAHALAEFEIEPTGLVMADVGASTGGFTDCLLQRGAARIYAIDVGYGQLDWRLRQDARVVVMERTHARELVASPEPIDAAVVDVSFISLRSVLPSVLGWMKPTGWIVALIKPQFEAGRGQVGKGGVVRDPAVHDEVVARVTTAIETLGKKVVGVTPSPILGPAGNREFLVYAC
jgi:23S rRNA (cytidine1920-2'-O)/16S rRNA (cytidine1409-2'-O)-methyltransferase